MDNDAKQVPTPLKVVASLFILVGVCSLIEILVSLMYGRIFLNLGVLGLFIGFGLLRLSRGWRTCGLVFLWIGMIGVPVVAILFISVGGPTIRFFGQKVGHASPSLGIAAAVVGFLITLWQYRVLTRPEVRELFEVP